MSTPAASGCSTGNVAVVFLLLVLRGIFPQHFLPRAARPDRGKSGNLLNGIGGLSKQASVTTVLTTQPGATLGNGLREHQCRARPTSGRPRRSIVAHSSLPALPAIAAQH